MPKTPSNCRHDSRLALIRGLGCNVVEPKSFRLPSGLVVVARPVLGVRVDRRRRGGVRPAPLLHLLLAVLGHRLLLVQAGQAAVPFFLHYRKLTPVHGYQITSRPGVTPRFLVGRSLISDPFVGEVLYSVQTTCAGHALFQASVLFALPAATFTSMHEISHHPRSHPHF